MRRMEMETTFNENNVFHKCSIQCATRGYKQNVFERKMFTAKHTF